MLHTFHKDIVLFYIFIGIIFQTNLTNATDEINVSDFEKDDLQSKTPSNHKYIIIITHHDTNKTIGKRNDENIRRSFYDIEDSVTRDIEKIITRIENSKPINKTLKEKNIEHAARIRYVVETILPSAKSTRYLYREMHRILNQNVVMDKLRRMIAHLEEPSNEELKTKVLACYYNARSGVPITGFDVFKTNNLVINVFKDPYSDNVLN